jgi:hypothetical protein
MLCFLTARSVTRMPVLCNVIAQLSPAVQDANAADPLRVYKLCRLLDMLGHAEYHRGRPGWLSVAAPHLGRLPIIGKERYILAGARTGRTEDDIRTVVASEKIRCTVFESDHQSNEPLLPRRVTLDFETPDDGRRLAQCLGIGFSSTPSAWTLACFSQGLNEFEASLQWHPRNLSLSSIQVYDPNRLAFVPCEEVPEGPILCRSAANSSLMYVVVENQEARVEDADWARHWALAKASVAAVRHDRRKRLVATPAAAPLPRLLARALCLASGDAPKPIAGDRRMGLPNQLIFGAVPPEIADKVAQKLGLGFAPQTINIPDPALP